jgi:hypothetical protein
MTVPPAVRHRRMEAKRARRRARTSGPSRGKVRGPVSRATGRAALMREGERKLLAISEEIGRQLRKRVAESSRRWKETR